MTRRFRHRWLSDFTAHKTENEIEASSTFFGKMIGVRIDAPMILRVMTGAFNIESLTAFRAEAATDNVVGRQFAINIRHKNASPQGEIPRRERYRAGGLSVNCRMAPNRARRADAHRWNCANYALGEKRGPRGRGKGESPIARGPRGLGVTPAPLEPRSQDRRAGRRARVSPHLGITRYLGAFGQKPPRSRRVASIAAAPGRPSTQAILQFVLIFNLGASIRSEGGRRVGFVGFNVTYADAALRDCARTRSV